MALQDRPKRALVVFDPYPAGDRAAEQVIVDDMMMASHSELHCCLHGAPVGPLTLVTRSVAEFVWVA